MPVYGLLGSGRLAGHLTHYFREEGLAVRRWARRPDPQVNTLAVSDHPNAEDRLQAAITDCSHVLVLLSDDAIAPFVERHEFLRDKVLIHCSGSQSIPGLNGAHPLMTFGPDLYELERYRAVPFVTDAEGLSFTELFPGLANSHYTLPADKKALYHAYCVISGNFSGILWERIIAEFETRLGLPREVLNPYMAQVFANLASADDVVTGPLVRRDIKTIARNLEALKGSDLKDVYEAFLRLTGIERARE